MKKPCKIIVLDDTCKTDFGGTALTLKALFEDIKLHEIIFIQTNELNYDLFNKTNNNDLWVIGNIFGINKESIKIIKNILYARKFIKIEFDYGFCEYRCEYGFKKFTGKENWEPFLTKNGIFLKNIYFLIHLFALKIFYMSKKQMDLHNNILSFDIDKNKQKILSSCFSRKDIDILLEKNKTHKNISSDCYVIIDGNNDWHNEAKGFYDSINYAKSNKLKFNIIKEKNYYKFLDILSNYKGLIFLPKVHDTCPRVTIESKIIGLELITNNNSQHITEEWFNKDSDYMIKYLNNRSDFFFNEIKEFL